MEVEKDLQSQDTENLTIAGETKFCSHCGKEIRRAAVICPHCGCQVGEIQSASPGVQLTKRQIILAVSAVLCVFLLLFGIWVHNNLLLGNDRIAYELMVKCADNFVAPASLRLVSGSIGVDKDCMWATVTAENGMGIRASKDYYFSDSGWVLEEEDGYGNELCKGDDFNVERINRAFAKRFSAGV